MLALGVASLLLTQSQSKSIPPIDFNNLPYQQQVKTMADGWRSKYKLPGVWIALIKSGRVVACVATGVKNIETGTPAVVTDHLNIGSVSKVVTGMMIAQFVAKGVISYDTTVGQVFPEIVAKYPGSPFGRATLAQLLSHTSGLTKKILFDDRDEENGIAWRQKHLSAALASNQTVAPGVAYEYSNAGPVIATSMVEKRIRDTALSNEWGSSYEEWLTGPPGRKIGLTNPRMLDYSKMPGADDIWPHLIQATGPTLHPVSAQNHLKQKLSYKFAPQGSCRVTLQDVCAMVLTTSLGNYSLQREPGSKHASNGWGVGADGRSFDHDGDTGRGDFCYVRAQISNGLTGIVLYTNATPANRENVGQWRNDVAKDVLEILRL
jgi:hypothetical protein